MSQQVESLRNLADEAGLPRQIMVGLVDNQLIANINDLRSITPEEVLSLRSEYNQTLEETPSQENFWTFLVTRRLPTPRRPY